MAGKSPNSPIPLIAFTIGLIFALVATIGALTAMANQRGPQHATLVLTPPAIDLPEIPHPTLPALPG